MRNADRKTTHDHSEKDRYVFCAWTLLIAVSLTIWLLGFEWTENKRFQENQRRSVVEQLSTVRARLEGELNAELLLTRSIITEIVISADITQDRFFLIAQHILETSKHIKNIGLAKGTVLTFVYPVEKNKAAIGLDYSKNTRQWPAVQRVIEGEKTVVAGPLNLVQGGVGIVSRTPIYIAPAGSDRKEYFGILSVVINLPSLIKKAGLDNKNSLLKIAIRGKDGLGADGEVFYGPEYFFTNDPALLEVTLPGGGSWLLAALPAEGWRKNSPRIKYYRIAALSAGLAVLLLLFIQQREMRGRKAIEAERKKLIKELERKNNQLRELAMTDTLTGLSNRRAISSVLENELSRNQRFGRISSILLLDIDHFKEVNDKFGHASGDLALQTISSCVGKSMRGTDSFARWGGEEFLILAAETSLENAGIFAERIRNCVEKIVYTNGMRITVSIGVAEFTDNESLDLCIKRADKALYKAKSCGRNRVELDTPRFKQSGFHSGLRPEQGPWSLQEQALSDPLTGLSTRRAMLSVLENEISRNERFGHISCILLVDIDHFQEINDTYGYTSGNLAVKAISSWAGKNMRGTDVFARWGEGTFLILTPETSLHNAVVFAEKIRHCVEKIVYKNGMKTTVSIGVAGFINNETITLWVKRADQALSKAKSHGENCVELE